VVGFTTQRPRFQRGGYARNGVAVFVANGELESSNLLRRDKKRQQKSDDRE
jgi:hypothetical protein